MKKLLFIALFSVGFFALSQAQTTLDYTITNNTTDDKWDFGINHDGLGGDVIELGIQPNGGVASSSISSFELSLTMLATDNDGCFGIETAPAVGFGTISVGCSTTVRYNLTYNISTDTYTLVVVIE